MCSASVVDWMFDSITCQTEPNLNDIFHSVWNASSASHLSLKAGLERVFITHLTGNWDEDGQKSAVEICSEGERCSALNGMAID